MPGLRRIAAVRVTAMEPLRSTHNGRSAFVLGMALVAPKRPLALACLRASDLHRERSADHAITVAQVQENLRSDGWLNVQTMEQGGYLEITGSKDDQAKKMMVDTLTGRLIPDDDN
jgi:hypothetical protein